MKNLALFRTDRKGDIVIIVNDEIKKGALALGLGLTGICVSGIVYSFTFLSILSVCGKCLMVDCSSCVIDSSDDVTRRRMRHQMFLQVITPRKSLQRKEGTFYVL